MQDVYHQPYNGGYRYGFRGRCEVKAWLLGSAFEGLKGRSGLRGRLFLGKLSKLGSLLGVRSRRVPYYFGS